MAVIGDNAWALELIKTCYWAGQYPNKTLRIVSFSKDAKAMEDRIHTIIPHGNVGELVHDWYGKAYASAEAVTDPQGAEAGEGRVLRGGSWFSGARRVRSAMRGRLFSGQRLDNVGLRLVLTPEQ